MSRTVTAIVLNYCGEDDTAACVESLYASSYSSLRVLIVDNGSPDGSGERLRRRFPTSDYLQTGGNFGYAGGNNRGIAWALDRRADYVLVVNDDAVVDPGCVSALVEAAEDCGAAAVAPQIRYFSDPELIQCGAGRFSPMRALGVHREYREPADVCGPRQTVTFVSGCCVLLRAAAVQQLGAFDESYFAYVEDAELSLRFVRAGQTLVYEPRARVLHRALPSARPSPFAIRHGDRNRRSLAARHYGLLGRLAFALWFYPTRIVHLARYTSHGDWARALATLEATFGR